MSISSSLSNALSGLSAASRAADVVSSNVANALTEGYGRRSLDLSARTLAGTGSGVTLNGVRRNVDAAVLSDRRMADATLAGATTAAGFFQRIEAVIGTPDDAGSLSGRIAGLEQSLITAASRPDSETRLAGVLRAASGLAGQIKAISGELQSVRRDADTQIATDVASVNDALQRIEGLNRDIRLQKAAGNDANALMDLRQQQVDRITPIIPLREVPRDNGQIALFTPGGAVLFDGKAAMLGFSPVGVITPDMSQVSGALSGLTINGRPVATGGEYSPVNGGSLAAQFAIRDELAVSAQTELDAVARDLIDRFASPAADATLAPGTAGLFTDAGVAFHPLNEVGLSGRITINTAADPGRGGALWRLRDGLGAATPGDVGNAAGLQDLVAALTASRQPGSGSFGGALRSASGLAGDFLSSVGADRQAAEADESFAAARYDTLRTLELSGGVDTDLEMQQLLLVEQAFSANARVIQTVDDMIQTLLRI